MSDSVRLNTLFLGLTAMFVGYFLTWLPGPAAGLQIIGLEMGEWIKFLGVGGGRNWFYLPPIAIGAIVALLAAMWPNDDWRTWLARFLAIAIALLAFPAIAAIQMEPRSEWLARLIAIGLVVIIAIGGSLIKHRDSATWWAWLTIAVFAFLGGLLPTTQYFLVRPVVEGILKQNLSIGIGIWLNLAGVLLVGTMAIYELRQQANKKDSR